MLFIIHYLNNEIEKITLLLTQYKLQEDCHDVQIVSGNVLQIMQEIRVTWQAHEAGAFGLFLFSFESIPLFVSFS